MNNIDNSKRIEKALEIAVGYSGLGGSHHQDWIIDQMVRALTGCPTIKSTLIDSNGISYEYEHQAKSEEYIKLVEDACNGEDGPDTYNWEVGIAP